MFNRDDSIFISIAAYRDPQLEPTIRDCIAKAKKPERLRFGICWQKESNETIHDLEDHPHIRIHDIDWKESKGACWARHIIQKNLFHNERFYLQLDSHHRFVPNWDEELISLYYHAKMKSIKPLIGSYATTYWPSDDKNLRNEPYRINTFDTFTTDGDLISRPVFMSNHATIKEPLVPARLLSGHYIFGDGFFAHECMYDPNYYFRGEELVLSARAYTNGYDMFHPTKTLVWHEYLRKEQHKHWVDHTSSNGFVVEAEHRNIRSKERQRKLFGMDPCNIDFKQYNLGTIRDLHEYELFAGIDFKRRRVHKYCADIRGDSPNPYKMTEEEWNNGMLIPYQYTVEWDLNKIPDNTEYDLWFFGFENEKNVLLWRKDFTADDPYYHQFFTKKHNRHTANFSCEEKPHHCVMIPHIKDKGWADKIIIPLKT